MGKPNTTPAKEVGTKIKDETQRKKIVLHFGIFFDGTNNQEVQVMIGKRYRRKRILQQLQWDANNGVLSEDQIKFLEEKKYIKAETKNYNCYWGMATVTSWVVTIDESELLKKPRSEWEQKSNGRGIIRDSDLDAIYFGYETSNNGIETHMEDHIAAKSANDEMIYSDSDKKEMNSWSKLQFGDDGLESQKNYIQRTSDTFKGAKLNENKDVDFNVDDKNSSQEPTYTNVALLESVFDRTKTTETEIYIPLYMEGIGTNAALKGDNDTVNGQGLGLGEQGVFGKLRKMCNEIRRQVVKYDKYDVEVYFYAFGFSRGATTARIFNYVATCEFGTDHKLKEINEDIKKILKDFIKVDHFLGGCKDFLKLGQVKFLGIYDTVGSIGLNVNYEGYGFKEHPKNVKKYHMYETDKAEFTFHICAIDEVRKNFALIDIENSISKGTGLEILLPGCHSDIGGGITIGMCDGSIPYNVHLWQDGIHSEASMKLSVVMSNNNYVTKALLKMGWLDDSKNPSNLKPGDKYYISDTTYGVLEDSAFVLHRRVKPGYSNIGLKLMHDFSKCSALFKAIPLSYDVPAGLKSLCSNISSQMGSTGRVFLYPDQSDYAKLRRNYITYSALASDLVNGSEVVDFKGQKVLARLVYTGEESSQIQHMYEFKTKEFKCVKY